MKDDEPLDLAEFLRSQTRFRATMEILTGGRRPATARRGRVGPLRGRKDLWGGGSSCPRSPGAIAGRRAASAGKLEPLDGHSAGGPDRIPTSRQSFRKKSTTRPIDGTQAVLAVYITCCAAKVSKMSRSLDSCREYFRCRGIQMKFRGK